MSDSEIEKEPIQYSYHSSILSNSAEQKKSFTTHYIMSKVSANCKKLLSCKKEGNELDIEIDGKYKIGCQNEHGEKWLIIAQQTNKY